MKNIQENIIRIRNLMFLNEDDNVDVQLNRVKTGSDQQIKQTGPTDDDGDNDAVDGMDEGEVDEEGKDVGAMEIVVPLDSDNIIIIVTIIKCSCIHLLVILFIVDIRFFIQYNIETL
jgi:hypothetical protein